MCVCVCVCVCMCMFVSAAFALSLRDEVKLGCPSLVGGWEVVYENECGEGTRT